jgi:predicted dehydrogenase
MEHHSNGRRLKGALVGYGFIGSTGHAPAYLQRSDVDIVAVVDGCGARRISATKQIPGVRTFASVGDLLRSSMSLDFIDVATPPSEHFDITGAALRRGLHVLCEKPLTTSAAHAEILAERAAACRRVVFPCHNYLFAPTVRAIGDVISSGRIGRVRSVTMSTFRPTHARGVPEWNPDWRRQRRWSGGGIAMDHGSHTLYLAFEWMADWPLSITAKMVNHEPGRWDTEDDFSATLVFPGERTAHVTLTWTAGARVVLYAIHGERGAIIARDDDIDVVTQVPGAPPGDLSWDVEHRVTASDWSDASHTGWFNAVFDRFLEAIESRDWAGADLRDACRCVTVIQEAYDSSSSACVERPLAASPGFERRVARVERRVMAAVQDEIPIAGPGAALPRRESPDQEVR